MAFTPVVRVVGATVALSVANASHAAVTVAAFGQGECPNAAMFVNTGANPVLVTVSQTGAPTSAIPADGASQGNSSAFTFVLPAAMQMPLIVAVPWQSQSFSLTAIGTVAGPALIFVTPLTNQ